MVCPHCGKASDGYVIVQGENLQVSVTSSNQGVYVTPVFDMHAPVDVLGAASITQFTINNTACSNSGLNTHYHAENL